jgi:eukaryotic-like serine/threonine-protein kinase
VTTHPERLGKYQVTGVLGEGAMGIVYKGFDPDIRRPVALKTIRRQLTDGSEMAAMIAARFRNEAQAAGRLAHPGIVGVYEYGEDQHVAYIAMEYVEGQSVARYLASAVRFTDTDIPGLMNQLLDALEHAHQQGVWHRDIKPANVILSRGARLKVADFGIARIDEGGLTQTHTMIGTPAYMAPEQFVGTAIDRRVDVYGAGVLLYVLLTGQPPFTGSAESLMYRVVHETPVPPSQVAGANRPRLFDALVATALAKDPAARFPSAAAFKDALAAAVGQPIDDTAWERTIVQVPLRPLPAGVERTPSQGANPGVGASSPGGQAGPATQSTTGAPANWDRALLAQAESSLAQFVGPLATLLVKRAARECDTLPALYQKLAEQVTDARARQAFLGRVAPTLVGASVAGGATAVAGGTTLAPPLQVDDAHLEQAQRLLARHIGPIARLLVKKAAAQARDRAGFHLRLAEAVDDPAARAALMAELEKLH